MELGRKGQIRSEGGDDFRSGRGGRGNSVAITIAGATTAATATAVAASGVGGVGIGGGSVGSGTAVAIIAATVIIITIAAAAVVVVVGFPSHGVDGARHCYAIVRLSLTNGMARSNKRE